MKTAEQKQAEQQAEIDIPPVLEEAVKETLVQLLLKNLGKVFRWLKRR